MVFIYILVALLLLISLILIIPIKMVFKYSTLNGADIFLYIWFYKLVLTQDKNKKKKKLSNLRIQKKENIAEKKSDNKNDNVIKELLELRSTLISTIKDIALKTEIVKIHIDVGADDAAKCAVYYGIICQFVSYTIEFINCNTKMKPLKDNAVLIKPDFTSNNIKTDILITLNFRIYNVIKILIDFAVNYFRQKIK